MSARREPPRPEIVAALERVDNLVRFFEEHSDTNVQEEVFGLLRSVDALHRGPLDRLRVFLDRHGLLADALADPDVALLFDLYTSEEGDEAEEESRPQLGDRAPPGQATRAPAVIPVSMVIRQTRLQQDARRQVRDTP